MKPRAWMLADRARRCFVNTEAARFIAEPSGAMTLALLPRHPLVHGLQVSLKAFAANGVSQRALDREGLKVPQERVHGRVVA